MPFISGGHLWLVVILLAIVLIVKGPGKLPEVGSGLGRAMREFKKATSEAKDVIHAEPDHQETAVVAAAAPVSTPSRNHETPAGTVPAER